MTTPELLIPEIIPVVDRYGVCEGALCKMTGHFTLRRKPMFTYAGARLCKECCRRARHA